MPDWDTLDTIKTVAGLWVSHLATNATAAQMTAKDIYLYIRDTALPKLAPLTLTELQQVDPTATQPFAAVDPADAGWPS